MAEQEEEEEGSEREGKVYKAGYVHVGSVIIIDHHRFPEKVPVDIFEIYFHNSRRACFDSRTVFFFFFFALCIYALSPSLFFPLVSRLL